MKTRPTATLAKKPLIRAAGTGRAMRQIDPALVRQMEQRLQCRKPQHIMDELGISLNTWDKLLCGSPIRASVADRIVDRFCEGNNG